MHRSKIQNIILHKSEAKSRCYLKEINNFSVNVIKRKLAGMPITSKEKMQIINEIITLLES